MIAQLKPQQHKFRSNIEAEEAILGGILLDPNAIGRVEKTLQPEAFAVTAHQIIYRTCLWIHQKGEQVDLMTVTTHLDDINQLDIVGGQMKLAQLVDRTVSAVNIDQYAMLVIREFLFRKLTQVGHEIAQTASEAIDIEEVFEEVEHKVVSITRSYKSGMFERESLTRFKQISKHLERIEDDHDDDPALKEWEFRQLANEFNFKSISDLLNFHAKWLQVRKNKANRSIGLQQFWEENNSPNQWIMRGFLPRKSLSILWGLGGAGKTLLTGSICQKLITGESWADYPVEQPTEVLLIETDQGANITAQQLEAQGFLDCDDSAKSRFRILSNWGIEDFGVLRRELEEIRAKSNAPIFVVVDSLTSVASSSRFSENDVQYARPLERLREIAERFDAAFLILHHGSKMGTMRGTTAIHNSADQVFRFSRVGKGEIPNDANLIIEKSRYRMEGSYRLKYQPEDRTWEMQGRLTNIDSVEGSEEVIESASAAFQRIYKILDNNRGKRFQAKELGEISQISEATVRRELTWGCSEGLIDSCKSRETSTHRGRRATLFSLAEVVTEFPSSLEKNSKAAPSKGLAVLRESQTDLSLLPQKAKIYGSGNENEFPSEIVGNLTEIEKNSESLLEGNFQADFESKNEFPSKSSLKNLENFENEKNTCKKLTEIEKNSESPPSKDSSPSEICKKLKKIEKNSEASPSKDSSPFFGKTPGIKDYYDLKAGDILLQNDTIVQIIRKVTGNCWELSKKGEYVSLADWQAGIVRYPTAQDIARSIEQNPNQKWFRWLYKNAQALQAEAILLIEDEKLIEQCYEWLNPPTMTGRAIAALETLKKWLIANPDKKVSRKKFVKDWGNEGEIAIENAVSEGIARLTKDYIISLT